MIINMYAIFDAKAKAYGQPFLLHTDGLAIRSFQQAATSPDNNIAKTPLDYSLFRIGQYNDEIALLISEAPPEFIHSAMQVLVMLEREQQSMQQQQKKETQDEIPTTT